MLNLYRNITPNLSGTHYYFKDFSKYLTLLASNLLKEIDETRYDINKGFIRVKLGNDLTEANYKEVTYIINTTDNMSYHVSSQIVQSGYAYYGVNVDLWASYIVNAKLKNINIKKCNRRLTDNGVLDYINHSKDFDVNYLGNAQINVDDLYVVFIIQQEPNLFNNTFSFACKFKDVYDAGDQVVDTRIKQYFNVMTLIRITMGYIKYINITSPITLAGIVQGSNIKQIGLIEGKYLSFRNDVTAIANFGIGSSGVDKEVKFVTPSIKKEVFNIELDFNKKYIIGVLNNGVNVVNTIGTKTIEYIYYVSQSGFNIYVVCDNQQLDITHAFSLRAYKEQSDENSQTLNKTLGILGSVVKTGLGALASSPKLLSSGLISFGSNLGNIGNNSQRSTNDLSTSGNQLDAEINFSALDNTIITRDLLFTPYKIITFTSFSNEYKLLRKKGAQFDEYIDELEDIFNYSLLGTGEVNDDTFIVASLDANEIPTSAIDLIEGRFASGVYLQYLQ